MAERPTDFQGRRLGSTVKVCQLNFSRQRLPAYSLDYDGLANRQVFLNCVQELTHQHPACPSHHSFSWQLLLEQAATTAIFGLRLSSAGGSISSTPSSPPSDTQQGPGSSGSSSSTPFNALKDALTTRKTSKDIKGSKRRSTSSSSSSGNKRRDFNRAADTYSSGRRNSKEREYFSRNSLSNTPAPSSSYEPVKLSTSSSSVAEGHLSRDQERRTLSQAQPDYRVIDPLPVKMDYKETSPLPAQLTAVTSPSPAKSTASTGTMTTPEVATGRSSTGLQESTVPGLLQLLPEQVLDQAVGDLLVVYKELDKAHNTLEAVLCRSRALEADNVVLRAGYMDVEQQLSWTKVRGGLPSHK